MPVRLVVLALHAVLVVALAGCGEEPSYALDPTADCIAAEATVERWEAGADAPAQGSQAPEGGVLRATFPDRQTAWAAFGEDGADAEEIAAGLEAAAALPGTFAELMRPVVELRRNAVVYGFFPEGDELTPGFQAALDAVERCLSEE